MELLKRNARKSATHCSCRYICLLFIKRNRCCEIEHLSQVNRNDNSRNFVLLLKVKNCYYAIFVLNEYSTINVHRFDWQAYQMTAPTKAKYDNILFLQQTMTAKEKYFSLNHCVIFLSCTSFDASKSILNAMVYFQQANNQRSETSFVAKLNV